MGVDVVLILHIDKNKTKADKKDDNRSVEGKESYKRPYFEQNYHFNGKRKSRV